MNTTTLTDDARIYERDSMGEVEPLFGVADSIMLTFAHTSSDATCVAQSLVYRRTATSFWKDPMSPQQTHLVDDH